MSEKIIQVDYSTEMQKSYLDYAMSVIVGRALPDVRDGLKPVHRRILYAMQELHLSHEKPYKKSARIVGDVLGKYHPHGDSPVYDAMVRLIQEFQTINPLILGHGNFGSIDGDSPAQMRYTEAKLTKLANKMLQDIDKDTIDFMPNFDNSLKEPQVLPSRFPNLLVNGSSGIAVGMKTDIPPHNLAEVIDATNAYIQAYIQNEDITTKELMKHIKAPDFPTGGTIINKDELYDLYNTGKGKIVIRADIEVNEIGYGKKQLVVTNIPYTMSGKKTALLEDIISKIKDKRLDELVDIDDESDSSGVRIILETRKDVNVPNLIAKLYKLTKLQDSFHAIFLAIDKQEPIEMNLKTIIQKYVEFQIEVNTRKYNYLLEKEKTRHEIAQGLLKATEEIDLIIAILKGSKTSTIVRDCFINGNTENITFKTKVLEKQAKNLKFTKVQTKAILDMKLMSLIGLETDKLIEDIEETLANIIKYEDILSSEENICKIISEELKETKKEFRTKRKTSVKEIEETVIIDTVFEEELCIITDKFNYIKSIDIQTYNKLKEDKIEFKEVINVFNTGKIAVFTQDGNLHQINVSEIPKTKIKDRGIPIESLYNNSSEAIVKIINAEELKEGQILFISEKSYSKLVEVEEFETNHTTIIASKMKDDDKLIYMELITNQKDSTHIQVNLSNNKTKSFKLNEIPVRKRNTLGVTMVKNLKENTILSVNMKN